MKIREQSPIWRRVARRLGRRLFSFAENNDDPRLTHNGERWLLHELLAAHARMKTTRPFVVFDAGANAGDYMRLVLQTAQQAGCGAEVHAFEPSPPRIEALHREFGVNPAVRLVRAAVADRLGDALLHDGRSGSSQASLVPRKGQAGDATTAVIVPLLRLEDYLEAQAVAEVDLLKLDVEGSELAALRGLAGRLTPDAVHAIQFEYGGTALDAGTTLRDFYHLLSGRGYVLAKLFPHALEVRRYGDWMEHYAYANYVALSPNRLGARRVAS